MTNDDVVSMKPLIFLAMEETSHIDWGLENLTIKEDTEDKHERGEVSDVEKNRKKSKNDLTMLVRTPPDLKKNLNSWTIRLIIANACAKTITPNSVCTWLTTHVPSIKAVQ